MNILVEKISDVESLRSIISDIDPNVERSEISLYTAYKRRHSFIRTQLFKITMLNIPTFVSVHLVRHGAVGQYHYVSSARDDWTQKKGRDVNRNSPVNHFMLLNAEHLIDMAGMRMCTKAHSATRNIINHIAEAIYEVDEDLSTFMVPKCFRQGFCNEARSCSLFNSSSAINWREKHYGEALV